MKDGMESNIPDDHPVQSKKHTSKGTERKKQTISKNRLFVQVAVTGGVKSGGGLERKDVMQSQRRSHVTLIARNTREGPNSHIGLGRV